jgi:lipoyl synthase
MKQNNTLKSGNFIKHPPWFTRRVDADLNQEVVRILAKYELHTVCESACCPNIWECFKSRRATFMILGQYCTRGCRFCAVTKGPLTQPDSTEADRLVQAAEEMGLLHVVITSVTRDDLADGGASIFALAIKKLREKLAKASVEVLTPDFQGNIDALRTVLEAGPTIFNHNVETVPRLYSAVRPDAIYKRSLDILRQAKSLYPSVYTKSGLIVGLGESLDEVYEVAKDLISIGCDILTVGQYLRPTPGHHPIVRYYTPEEFSDMEERLRAMGFSQIFAGPLVRSSYQAGVKFSLISVKTK